MTLLQQALSCALAVSALEPQLVDELNAFAAAVRDAGLRDPLGGRAGGPTVDWDSTGPEGIVFELLYRDWGVVRVLLPAAWFTDGAAGVEAERQRQDRVEQARQDANRAAREQELQYHERQIERLRQEVAR